ncbi:MAG: outer membrane lipoprotein carrier protein LolA [Porphyromonadaceae bacterium]|nr:outer membrane lipoprotein carrier protein LolA [Porphyromonadaceae bacterium]
MKSGVILFAALLLYLPLFSQNNATSKAIMDKAFAGFETSQGIQLFFKITSTDAKGNAYEPQTGAAFIKGNRFKLEMESTDIWFDGETQWVYIKETNEVNISKPDGQELATVSPLALLGMYKNGYILKVPISKTINGIPVWQIEMIPATGNKNFKAVTAAISKKNNTVVQVILTTANHMKTQIDITRYNANHQFDNAMFRFDKTAHPGAEIIDLR